MTALWIVGILLLIFLAVQLCRVGVRVTFGEETRVTARFGLVRVQLLPRKEKKSPKERPKKEKKNQKTIPFFVKKGNKKTGEGAVEAQLFCRLGELAGAVEDPEKGTPDDVSAHQNIA